MHIFRLDTPDFTSFSLDSLPDGKHTVIALGNFDGVHLAHRHILQKAIDRAAQINGVSAVFTFQQSKTPYITTFDERMALFASMGIEMVFAADFDAFKRQSPEDFVQNTLIRSLSAAGVSCGFNFRFGYMAAGDEHLLRTLCADAGIDCSITQPVVLGNDPISSTAIRKYVSSGNLENAAQMLGRPYSLSGKVVHGRAVGRQMNRPTMNLAIDDGRLLPPYGVYFTLCRIDGKAYPAVTNIGIRPTFNLDEVSCESYLLAASGDFYDKSLTVEFLHFRRPERKFEDQTTLMQAIAADSEAARQFFGLNQP